MKTGIERFFDLLTCRFLKIFFLNRPQQASPVPILIFQMPLPPIFSFTKSLQIFSTLRKFCQFSYPATCHLTLHRGDTLYPDTCHLTHDTRFAWLPTPQARLPTTHSRLLILQSRLLIVAQPAPQVSRTRPLIAPVFVPLSSGMPRVRAG